jgi:hypothetical protein
MAEKNKGILEEALSELNLIKEDIAKNARHALRTTLREDLESVVAEIAEDDDEELEDNTETPSFAVDDTPVTDDSVEDEMGDSTDSPEITTGPDVTDTEIEVTPTDSVGGGEEEIGSPAIDFDADNDSASGEEEVTDLTNASDDELMTAYRKMTPDDDFEIVKDGDDLEIKIGGEEVIIKNVDQAPETAPAPEETSSDDKVEESKNDEKVPTVMEVEITEPTDEKELRESVIKTRKKYMSAILENKRLTEENKKLTESIETFKNNEVQYKDAVKVLKNQISEVALFTSNLTYAVRLMTENTTTKDEKSKILKMLDKAKTLTESREIYNELLTTFTSKRDTSAQEILENKILKNPIETVTSENKKQKTIKESTVYRNPELDRIIEIMNKIDKK